jgi:tRNA pseudouridine38-40 synthase
VHQLFSTLDVDRMNQAAALLVGEHDFAGFAAAGHGRLTTIRTIFACGVTETPGECEGTRRVRIEVTGSGFLWNMVRIIGGTLVEVGRGRKTLDDVRAALASGDRRLAGPTLPPTGLCLEWIKYGT